MSLERDVAASLAEAEFSAKERQKLAQKGVAMSDGSFPIRNAADLENAKRAVGRAPASKRAAVRAHIGKRAKALGISEGYTYAAMGGGLRSDYPGHFDPVKHPRGRHGKFIDILGKLRAKRGRSGALPKGATFHFGTSKSGKGR